MGYYVNLKTGKEIKATQYKGNVNILPFTKKQKSNNLRDNSGHKFLFYTLDKQYNLHFCLKNQECRNYIKQYLYSGGYQHLSNRSIIKVNDFIIRPFINTEYQYMIYSPKDFKKNYGALEKIPEHEFINKKSGKHYDVITWNGSTKSLGIGFLDSNNYDYIDKNYNLHLVNYFDDYTGKPIAHIDDKIMLYDNNDEYGHYYFVCSPSNFKKEYVSIKDFEKKVNLPKYLYVITENPGEYTGDDEEDYTIPIRVVNSRSKANHIINYLEHKYYYGESFDVTYVPTGTNHIESNIYDELPKYLYVITNNPGDYTVDFAKDYANPIQIVDSYGEAKHIVSHLNYGDVSVVPTKANNVISNAYDSMAHDD